MNKTRLPDEIMDCINRSQNTLVATFVMSSFFQGYTQGALPQGGAQIFYDYYLGNFFDPVLCGPNPVHLVMFTTNRYPATPEELMSLDTRAVFAGAASGVMWEAFQSQMSNRDFDYADCGMYLAGALTFAALTRKLVGGYKPTSP